MLRSSPCSHVLVSALLALSAALAPALRAQRAPVEARHALVTSVHHLASEAGVEILKKGGNAVDAAAATAFALGVVYPFAGTLGTGGFMLVHLADGRDVVIDYRETAPSAASRDMYLGPDGNVLSGPGSSTFGWRASGVPGMVDGFALAQQRFGSGKVTWADVIEPARRLAADGHVITQYSALLLSQTAAKLTQFPESKRIFLADGAMLKTGELWRQPDLAATLARLQKNGPREFYEGETARRIADAMAKNAGTIALADLKNYRAVERTPIRGTYRGYEIVSMPPPSSGGLALLQMLGMLEPFDIAKLGPNSAAKYHLFTEAMRRAFRDRAEYLGDPDFVTVPVAQLLDRAYLKKRMADFSPTKATPSDQVEPGLGPVKLTSLSPRAYGSADSQLSALRSQLQNESTETTHFSIVDSAGNAVSNTYTLNGAFGSCVTIPGTGILMNNEMDDFTSKIGVRNMFGLLQGPANAIAPGKRPLSAMTPTFVLKDGKIFLVTGSPGGPTIINTVLAIITNVIDHGMNVQQAVDFPRFHHQWIPDELNFDRYSISPDTMAILRSYGHKLNERPSVIGGDGETIAIDPQTKLLLGAADPRKPDSKSVGY
jgi:gamma-glutamyltranspeptidase/glutathione hydrolase